MALEKGFLHRKLQFSDIPLTRRYIGPFMGVLFAIAFYALLYLLRDIFRAMPDHSPEDFWALSQDELQFYNFFYAALASLIGQSICISIWLNRSRKVFSPPRLVRIRIVHDQRFFNWYFLAWFSKVAFVFWGLFGYAFWGGHYVFSLYPDYRFLFYLILIVLFLQSWTSFRLLFQKQSFKWFVISAFILGSFSFGLSRINLIDQEAFQYNRERESIYFKYDFELPQAAFYENIYYRSLALKVQVVLDTSKHPYSPYSILIQGNHTTLDGLLPACQLFRNNMWEPERSRAFAQLYVDARVSIAFVEKVKTEIANAGIRKFYYMVVPENPEYDVRYYNHLGISDKLWESMPPFYNDVEEGSGTIIPPTPPEVIHQLKINTDKLGPIFLAQLLKQNVSDRPGRIIRYRYNPSDKFSKYIRMLSATYLAMEDLKKEYARKNYGKNFNDLKWEQRSELDNRFSVNFQGAPKQE